MTNFNKIRSSPTSKFLVWVVMVTVTLVSGGCFAHNNRQVFNIDAGANLKYSVHPTGGNTWGLSVAIDGSMTQDAVITLYAKKDDKLLFPHEIKLKAGDVKERIKLDWYGQELFMDYITSEGNSGSCKIALKFLYLN